MYQVNSEKRYNVKITQKFHGYAGGYEETFFKNVKLIAIERAFVAFEDEGGDEHIFTGGFDIHIETA